MTGIQYLACLWTLFNTQTGLVRSDLRLLERHEGDSVVFPCAVAQRHPAPFGVYLKRSLRHPSDVLFMYTESDFSVGNDDDRGRLSVSGDPGSHSLNVTVARLRASDTDRYHCEFVVNNPSSEDERVQGESEFFLLVTAGGHCSCSGYSALLYALSSAVAALLLVLIGFVAVYKGRASHGVKSQHQAPIYEEMARMKPLTQKQAPHHLAETESSEYRNCPITKSCPENHYESPSGALCPRT